MEVPINRTRRKRKIEEMTINRNILTLKPSKNSECMRILEIVKKTNNNRQEEQIFQNELFNLINISKSCDTCLNYSMNAHRCRECCSAQYCSKACQIKDSKLHLKICRQNSNTKEKKIVSSRTQKKRLAMNNAIESYFIVFDQEEDYEYHHERFRRSCMF